MNWKKEEVKTKVLKLVKQEDFKKYLLREIDRVLDSGYIPLEKDEKESYALAKLVLYLALKKEAEQYRPIGSIGEEYKQLIKNY